MKYEITKGSEKDFDGAPEWATVLLNGRFAAKAWASSYSNGAKALTPGTTDKYIIDAIEDCTIIAERRPITEPELKPIYGDGIHDDSDALQQRIDMGIDIKPILNNGVFLTLKPLQFKPITEPVWLVGKLPPVGTKVDIISDIGDSIVFEGSLTGEVIAHVEDNAVVRMSWGLACFKADRLRPIRSPEDVAREKITLNMLQYMYSSDETDYAQVCKIYDAIASGKIKGVVLESKAADLKINITTEEMWREFEKNSDMEDVRRLVMEMASRRGSF